jgi:hypothetical protein
LWLDPEDDSEPLAYAQPLGFGEPWEEDFLHDYDAQAANGSSGFSTPPTIEQNCPLSFQRASNARV